MFRNRPHANSREKAGSTLFFVSTLIPGLIVSGFMPLINVLPFWGWALVAAVGGAAGGAIYQAARPDLGAIAGGTSGATVVVAIYFYVMLRASLSSTYWTVEFLIPACIGLLPGWIILKLAGADQRGDKRDVAT